MDPEERSERLVPDQSGVGRRTQSPALSEQRAELRTLWIRYRPRRWPGSPELWLDLAASRLRHEAGPPSLTRWPSDLAAAAELGNEALDDVLYLPPVAADLVPSRERLIDVLRAAGGPLVVQTVAEPAGNDRVPAGDRGLVSVLDPIQHLTEIERLRGPESDAVLLFPTVAFSLLGEERFCRWLAGARAAGWHRVHVVAAELEPAARRRLLQHWRDEAAFDALFHSGDPEEREVCRRFASAGLEPIVERPLPAGPERLVRRRELAGVLATCGELWLRTARPPGGGQELLRAARFVDELDYDLAGLLREGNLRLIPGLEGLALEVMEQTLGGGHCELLELLRCEVLEAGTAGSAVEHTSR